MHIFVDVTETWKTGLRTGVQRVVTESARQLRSLPGCQLGVYDSSSGTFRALTSEEEHQLLDRDESEKTKAKDPGSVLHRTLDRLGLFRPAALVLDLIRRFTVHPRTLYHEDWDHTIYLTAEVVGDRARGRKLNAWSQRPGFQTVFIVHDLIPLTHPELSLIHPGDFRRYLSLLRQASLLVADSDQTKLELTRWHQGFSGSLPRLVRLYPGFARPVHRPTVGPSTPLFLCVGTIEPRKNQERLLTVLEQLWKEGRHFDFVFVGGLSQRSPGFKDTLERLVESGHPVRWLNPATEEQLEVLYHRALATVYISSVEGFGLPVVESVSRGTPCIASEAGSVGEIAQWFGGCILVDPGFPGSWKGALEAFLDQADLRAAVLSTVKHERFRNWTQYSSDLIALLEGQ